LVQGIYSSASALRAYSSAQSVTANNIANVSTQGFQSSFATFSDLANRGGVQVNSIQTNDGTGYRINTDRSLDFSINGAGYFQVTDAGGDTILTRNGAFSVDADGNMVDTSGNIVAADVGEGRSITVDERGNIYSDGAYRGQIEVVDRYGNPQPENTYSIESGSLEASNVDIAREIVSTIVNERSYEANISTFKSNDEMLGMVIDMVG
jgi:flagellar basal body rod protein FlgG